MLSSGLRSGLLSLCFAAALLSSWTFGYNHGKAEVQAKLDSYKASVAVANANAQKELSASFQTVLQDRENSLQALRLERDSLLGSLRNRQPRPGKAEPTGSQGGNSAAAPASAGCSPDKLYREDAEAFASFAVDAETVRQELLSSREAYDKARALLAP